MERKPFAGARLSELMANRLVNKNVKRPDRPVSESSAPVGGDNTRPSYNSVMSRNNARPSSPVAAEMDKPSYNNIIGRDNTRPSMGNEDRESVASEDKVFRRGVSRGGSLIGGLIARAARGRGQE